VPAHDDGVAIRIEGLHVVRGGVTVIPDLAVDVPAGSVTGLLGPSGCGKSTLMRSIVGTQRVAGGRVSVLGRPAGAASLRREVGYVTQAPSVYADLTARENLAHFSRVLGTDAARVEETIATLGLEGDADRPVASLSGGQRARVSLGVALLGEPRLLVLDEPTVGLDPLIRRELWDEFHRLAGRGVTLLISSHVMDEAAECARLLLMREGRIIHDSTPGELLRETGAADLSAAFLALIRRPAGEGA
jgi:ABC-2 type transport system ATP-binding protein